MTTVILIGKYELESDIEVKIIPDGYEIFKNAIEKYGIKPTDFCDADWRMGSIVVFEI